MLTIFFFFSSRRRHTRCGRDWSSDVCSSDLDSRILLTNLTEECGFRVITADSGEQALRRAREVQPDLILLDLMMPEMDGWQVLTALKADPQLRSIPVVVASIVAGENRGTLFGA